MRGSNRLPATKAVLTNQVATEAAVERDTTRRRPRMSGSRCGFAATSRALIQPLLQDWQTDLTVSAAGSLRYESVSVPARRITVRVFVPCPPGCWRYGRT